MRKRLSARLLGIGEISDAITFRSLRGFERKGDVTTVTNSLGFPRDTIFWRLLLGVEQDGDSCVVQDADGQVGGSVVVEIASG